MKRIYLLLLFNLCLLLGSTVVAQQNVNHKWGKPSQLEWSLQAWGEAPDAEAAVLYKTMTVTYQVNRSFASYSDANTLLNTSSIEHLGTNENVDAIMNCDVRMRIKILKDSGTGYANIGILYYNEEADSKRFDELERVRVVVYRQNEKGKVTHRNIDAKTYVDTRADAHYMMRKVLVPDVQKGDIIEYQYSITSSRYAFLYECSFQEDIPLMYVKCDMDIPAFLQFDMKVPVHPFVKSKVVPGAISGPQRSDFKAPDRYPSNHYTIEGHDILPKGLDLQRSETEAARVQATSGAVMSTRATLKLNTQPPAPMPEGTKSIVLNVK